MANERRTRGKATNIDAHVGGRLRFLREERSLTQEALAQRVDITFQQIQKYERGANRVSASRLFAFASILAVPVEAFFDGLPQYPTEGVQALADLDNLCAFGESHEGKELMRAFSSISDNRARREILQLIRVLASDS